VAAKVQAVCKKYDIPYNTGTLLGQYKTVVQRVLQYSKPTAEEKAAFKQARA